jgi:hypothetical protein
VANNRRRWVAFAAIVLALLAIGIRTLIREHYAIGGKDTSVWIRHSDNDNVIVFVHGIYGGPADTWTCAGQQSWPKMLTHDHAFDDFDVYVAGYDTPYIGNAQSMREVMASLNQRLSNASIFEAYEKVVFVAHSMGGLVVQELLVNHHSYGKQVPLIYFFATPQTGAQIANLAHAFSDNPLLEQMRTANNYYLQDLEEQWRQTPELGSIRGYCAYEKIPTKGLLVVDNLSATRNCNNDPVPINRNHSEIVKPCSTQDDAYTDLRYAVIKDGHPADKQFIGLLGNLVDAIPEVPRTSKRSEQIGLDPVHKEELTRFRVTELSQGPTWRAVAQHVCEQNPCLACMNDDAAKRTVIGVKGTLRRCGARKAESYSICSIKDCPQ